MANHAPRADDDLVEGSGEAPAVQCLDCRFEWHSRVMAEGLRLLGSCPKCGGKLEFADSPNDRTDARDVPRVDVRAPHLVLGVPRR